MDRVKNSETNPIWARAEDFRVRVATMLFCDDMIDAVDSAGRGKLPSDNLRLRTRIEGARARAQAEWLRIHAAAGADLAGHQSSGAMTPPTSGDWLA